MRLRIIIDDQDRNDAPKIPLTLTVYRDDDDGGLSRIPQLVENQECLIGANIPRLLLQLSAALTATPIDFED